MADYINGNILCQAYVHINPVSLSPEKLAQLQEALDLFVAARGRFFLYEDVNTSVKLKEGSLKVYGTIAGSLYLAISNYGGFREGVDYLAQDTKRLAECIASESLFLSQSRHQNTLRVEARTGVVGTLKVIIDKIEITSAELGDVEASVSAKRLSEVTEKLDKLLLNLKDPKDLPFVSSGLCEFILKILPERPPEKPKDPHSSDGLAYFRNERRRLIELLKKNS